MERIGGALLFHRNGEAFAGSLRAGLLALIGRTRTPSLSLSNSSRSPGPTPKMRRTSRGTVI